jgi:hypothetical protein
MQNQKQPRPTDTTTAGVFSSSCDFCLAPLGSDKYYGTSTPRPPIKLNHPTNLLLLLLLPPL